MANDAASCVREFWTRMATNDFDAVRAVLADDFVLEWPQSRERIRGGARFAQMNREYPSHGPWRFVLHRLVAEGDRVVSHVGVTDGVLATEAISFFTVHDGRIVRIVEYWPDAFPARADRAHLVEPLD